MPMLRHRQLGSARHGGKAGSLLTLALAVLGALVLALGSAYAAPRVLQDPSSGEPGSLMPFALRAAKAGLAPNDPRAKVESSVLATTATIARLKDPRNFRPSTNAASNVAGPGLPVDAEGRLYVRIAGSNLAAHEADFEALGIEIAATAPETDFLEAWVPASQVLTLAAISDVRLVGVPGTPVFEIGSRLSEGDAIHRANLARTTFSIDGTGARVGVISDGVTTLATSQGSSDLPATVQVGNAGSGDEGTAMLEIVHDLAPGAGLAFYGAGSGSAGVITAMNWLAGTGACRTIVDDIWLPREPYFQDGPVGIAAGALATAAATDVAYFTSAGNRAQRHIDQAWRDGGTRSLGSLGSFRPHDFGAGDVLANVRLRNIGGGGTRHTIVLQWSELFGSAGQDFDLYLLNASLTSVIAASTNLQDGNDDPFELLDFTWSGADNTPAVLVVDFAGPGTVPANGAFEIKLAANGPTFLEYGNATDSVNPHARHPLVFAVGAIDAADAGNDTAEPFSSRGPATMRLPAVVQRNKPDAMAIDGVQVTGVGGFPTPFFGTSAAAPHAAALSALIRGARPDLNSAQVRDLLRTTAIDLGPPGYDGATGAGRLDAMAALSEILNRPPVAVAGNDMTVECTGPPGTAVQLDGRNSYDPDNDPLTYAWTAPGITFDNAASSTPTGTFPLGSTLVTLTVNDGIVSDSDDLLVTIVDTTPPVVSVTLTPDALWPPNHRLAAISAAVSVLDECDPAPVIRLASITSNEPDNGVGDGDTANDIQQATRGSDDRAFLLRSERQGPGDTRVYTVCYEAEDASHRIGTGCATVVVTHDQSAAATFAPATEGGDPWAVGGFMELALDGLSPAETMSEQPLELGSGSFARRVVGGDDPTPPVVGSFQSGSTPEGTPGTLITMRWFVSAHDLQQLGADATDPMLYARVEAAGSSWLASVPLPAPSAAAASGLAAANQALAPGGSSPAGAPALALAVRAATPLRAGGRVELVLPDDGPVLARLVSATGRIVATLARESRARGVSELRLPAGLRAGIYVVTAQTASGATRAKIVVLP